VRKADRIDAELQAGESCELVIGALRTINPSNAAGKLCLTGQRLLFVPNGYGNLRRRLPWSIGRAVVASVDVAKRTWQPYNAPIFGLDWDSLRVSRNRH
jgi:hypothetical protein